MIGVNVKKKTKILLGVLLTLIIAIVCYVITGVIIYNYNVTHPTYSSGIINSINSSINMCNGTSDEIEYEENEKEISQKEMIEYLEEMKSQGKIKDYVYGSGGVMIEFLNGGKMYCNRYMPGYQSAGSTNTDNSRNKVTSSSFSENNALSVLTAQPYANDIEMASEVFDNSAFLIENADLGYKFTDNIDDENVTVDFMKSLSKYRVVIFDGHGVYNPENNNFVGIALGEYMTDENFNNYIDDINSGRLSWTGDYRYVVTPAFFEHYYKNDSFNDTLIYFGCCDVANDDSNLSEILIKKGAEAVLAYKNSVNVTYSRSMCETIFNELVKQDGDAGSTNTVAEALETAKKQNGEKDPTNTTWYDFILHPIFQDYVKKADRAELILTENDDNSFRLVDENKKENNKQADNVDYEKIYYQYIKDNLNIIDYDKFPVDKNNTGVFSTLIEDFDNDNVKEMITFTYEKEKDGSVVLNLYKYLDDKVTLSDTSNETIYASGGGVWSLNMCGVFEDKTIKIQSDGYSYGGSYHYSAYMSYKVKDNKLICANNYSLYKVPKYETYEYKEIVSGKTYSNENDFTSAVKTAGYDTEIHLHAGYTNSKFNPETDNYENNELFKGNHIFTLISSDSMIKSGVYGFINDNTNLKNQLGISSSSKENTTKVTTTVKNETTTDSNLNDELLNYYWENNIQSPHVYEFKDDNTVIEYDALPNEPKSTWSYCAQGTYSIKNNKLIVDFSYDYGEYSFKLQYLTLKENVNWDAGLYLQEHLKDNEYFFYEVDFEPATNGPAGNAFYLQKGIKK